MIYFHERNFFFLSGLRLRSPGPVLIINDKRKREIYELFPPNNKEKLS